MKNSIRFTLTLAAFFLATQVHAQGQDGTPAERDIMIMSELLPGLYKNANQSYFDVRLKNPESERHASTSISIAKLESDEFGEHAFSAEFTVGDDSAQSLIYALEVDYENAAVRMKTYVRGNANSKLAYQRGCDLLWRQQAGQFATEPASSKCGWSNGRKGSYQAQLSESSFWLRLPKQAVGFYQMEKARNFNCYVDVPGVGGGRDIPYERVALDDIHDLGGEKWFTTKDGQEIGVSLFRVMWPMNNYDGIFARPSFVLYAKTKEDGESVEKGYAWTSPDAQRIGINLKWMLANCYLISNADVVPFFKTNEPKL